MYKSNIEFIINSTNRDEPVYGILALIGDTLESMKSDVASHGVDAEQRKVFKSAMKDMVSGMIKLDGLLDTLSQKVR